jgi:hypothetical protein
MLNSMFDQLSGALARRRFMPKRLILDLSEARERKIAVVELPRGSYSFGLRDADGGGATLTMEEGVGTVRDLATFDDPLAAREALRSLKVATLRPFRKIICAAAGVLFILFVCDAALSPRGFAPAQVAQQGGLGQPQAGSPAIYRGGAGLGAPSLTTGTPAGAPAAPQSSPEVAEAIRMLKGQ